MRSISIALAVIVLVVLPGGIAAAGSDSPDITVANRVDQGSKLKVTVRNCLSGKSWQARIHLTITTEGQDVVWRKSLTPNETGIDRFKIRMRPARYPSGTYRLFARCAHEFNDGGEGTYYEEYESFRVREA